MELNDDQLMVEGILLEPEGFKPDPEAKSEDNSNPIPSRYWLAYTAFFADYIEPRFSSTPTRMIPFDDDTVELSFDLGLFAQLFDIYLTDGWSGIRVAEKTLLSSHETSAEDLQQWLRGKTTSLSEWNYTVLFFNFCKNMLALIIRDELISIEGRASTYIYTRVIKSYGELAVQWKKYSLKSYDETQESDSIAGHGTNIKVTRYAVDDPAMIKDLSALLNTLFVSLKEFQLLLDKLSASENLINYQEYTGMAYVDPESRYKQDVEDRNELASLKDMTEGTLKNLKSILQQSHPAGILVMHMLKEGFEDDALITLLGATLDGLRKEIENLSGTLRSNTNYTEILLPLQDQGEMIKTILMFKPGAAGPERTLIDQALKKFEDHGPIALLNDQTLLELLGNETIPTDSIEYVVAFRYMMELTPVLENIAKQEEESSSVWRKVQTVSASLSLAALITPQTALATILMRIGASISGVALMVHTAHSITDALKQRDQLIRNALLSNDSQSQQGLSRLGEMVKIKKDVFENLETELVLQILASMVGAKWAVTRDAMLWTSYFDDVRFLLDELDETETEE